ncbi:MAG TPA: beta-ketoacyl synthase N-terminal-like domain-containing protein [Bryobacteraceae bacterium]|nr:beta-ketoacyl synthase N-terminal-like domain-containing protein [Bryobacteraceae bacterium]
MSDRLVATGAGVISSLGAGWREFEQALYGGARAASPSERFGPGYVTAEVRGFEAERWLGNKGLRGLDRAARLVCVATHFALSEAGLCPQQSDGDPDIGLICGTVLGSVHSITAFDWSGVVDGPKYVSPLDFPNTVINSPIGQAAIRFKLRGVNSMLCAGMASGLSAIGYAAGFLRLGRARALVAGGAEEMSEELLHSLSKISALSAAGAARPFGRDRDGMVLGEGAAFLVLESQATAEQRGARPWAEISGFGSAHQSSDSDGSAPAIAAAQWAIERALARAEIKPNQIAALIAGASGNPALDEIEARALTGVFGDLLEGIPVCAPKAALGEAFGASGAMGALVAALALMRQSLPPTAGFEDSDVKLRLSAQAQPFTGDYVMVTTMGCDGNHAALILRRAE